ncbi:MAG: hypothetical protein VZS44_11500 [Bacilli bacterium]|nr:hypothetical protein [Bacilli bacterium]
MSREQLELCVDKAEKTRDFGRMIAELLDDLEQIPIELDANEDGEILPEDLPKYLTDTEIFTENPYYKEEHKDFCVFDNEGKLFIKVLDESDIKCRYNNTTFKLPYEHGDTDTRDIFLDLCEMVQRKSGIKYPNVTM